MMHPRSAGAGRPLATLFDGPLDVVGDVHGEIDALRALLGHLGYGADGLHPQGRHVVFVGDLCDRGPDSPAVLDLVMAWVGAGRAQCALGNHEFNMLLGEPKHGNGWFFDRNHELRNGEFLHSRAATAERRDAWLGFLDRLPLTLARDDLRVVHACWDDAAIGALGPLLSSGARYREVHDALDAQAKALLRSSGIDARAAREVKAYRHAFKDRDAALPLLPACAEEATILQNANPIKVLTSGLEGPSERPAWAGGRWRMTVRARWWQDYRAGPAVVMGHYWRRDRRAVPADVTGDWDYPLEDYDAYEWMGPRRNVFCVDYSVGGRYLERARGGTPPYQTRLAALRWPERTLVFDDGESIT